MNVENVERAIINNMIVSATQARQQFFHLLRLAEQDREVIIVHKGSFFVINVLKKKTPVPTNKQMFANLSL